MLTTSIRVKLIAFVVVALVAMAYLGARYAGITLVSPGYQVTVVLPDAGVPAVDDDLHAVAPRGTKSRIRLAASPGVS